MQILHLIPQIPYFNDNSIVGGAANMLFNLATNQAESDEVTVAGFIPNKNKKFQTCSGVTLVPLNVVGEPGTIRFGLNSIRSTVSWVREQGHKFNIIHAHSGFLDYVITSVIIQTLIQKPVIHSLYCPVPTEWGRWNRAIYKQLLLKSVDKLAVITALSCNIYNSLHDYGLSRESIRVVPPAINLQSFWPGLDNTGLRKRLGLAEDEFVFLFIGNTKPAKNLTTILQAIAKVQASFPEVKLVITTELKHSSSMERERILSQQIKDLNLLSSIVQLGIVNNMSDLIRMSDVLVAPFLDTFGPSDYFMAALEAMACGRPVIVSSVGGMSEVVDGDVGFMVDPHNPDELSEAMKALITDRDRRFKMGKRAALIAHDKFAPERVANEFYKIYEAIL